MQVWRRIVGDDDEDDARHFAHVTFSSDSFKVMTHVLHPVINTSSSPYGF